MISLFGLNDKVYFLPPTSYDYLPSITSSGNIGLAKFTSEKNAPLNDYYLIGASNKITEYLSMSLPIIFPNTMVNKDFLKDHNIGLVCNSDEPFELAQTIDSILMDKKREDEMRTNARRIFEENLNYDIQFSKILSKLEKVLQ
jgi:glycosyltransferase involved in cell wall biosynthesis